MKLKPETLITSFVILVMIVAGYYISKERSSSRDQALPHYTIDQVITQLIQIESGGDYLAIGDGGKAVGILQIHPIMVKEVNRILGKEIYELSDRVHPVKSIRMCRVFLSRQIRNYRSIYGEYPDERTLAGSWNTGSIFKRKPMKYLKKYREMI